MHVSLPEAVTTFFAISNGADPTKLDQCFTEGSVVRDEQRTHKGLSNIARWLTETRKKTPYTVEPLNAVEERSALRVHALVRGSFPGSPVELDHIFHLENDRIVRLEILS